MRNLITCLSVCVLSAATFAETWTVDDDGKADFDNIQAAVDAASNGDEIIVMPGTYTSTQDGHVVNMLGKAVTLRSSDPSDPDVVAATIIDGENKKRGIVFFNGETDETIVNGLTITNCAEVDFDFDGDGEIDYWEQYGGGIYCHASPTVINCVISYNSAFHGECGAGMFCNWNSAPTLSNCSFNNNDCSLRGGAIALLWNARATLSNCVIESNHSTHGGGGMYIGYSSAVIDNCVIRLNSHGGIYTFSSNPSENPTIIDSVGCDNVGYHVYGDYIDGGGNQWASNCSDIDQDGDGVPDNLDNCYLYNPDQADCNNNEIGDVCDIADGISEDINSDSIPDECQCLSDFNGDGYVNVTDLLAVIDQWGATDSPADVTGDGIVNVSDLLIVIGNWGPCE